MIILFLFSILFSNENYQSYLQKDSLRIEKIVLGNENNAFAVGDLSDSHQLSFSNDYGRNFDLKYKIKFTNNENRSVNSIGYADNKFILLLDSGYVYKVDNSGNLIDTIRLPVDYIYSYALKNAYSDKYMLAIYSMGSHYNPNDDSDTTFYKFYLTDDAYETFQEITIDEIKHGNNLILNSIIINNKIYFNNIERRKVSQGDTIHYVWNYCIYTYDINTKEFNKLYSLNYDETKKSIENLYVTQNDDIFLLISESNKIENTRNRVLFKLVDSNLVYIDTIYNGKNNNIQPVTYISNDYLVIYSSQYIKRIDVNDYTVESARFDIDLFPNEGQIGNIYDAIIWRDSIKNTFLINLFQNLIYEFDLDFLLSTNSIESLNSNGKIFPNPAPKGQSINIELDEYAEKVEIYDLLGNKLKTIEQFSRYYEIPTGDLTSGIYITIIEFNGKKKISKFVVE